MQPSPPPGGRRGSFFWDRLPTVVMAAVGVVALGLTAWWSWHLATLLAHASRTMGTVVRESGHPTIRFTTADGQVAEFVQNGGFSGPLGAEVPVAYDPGDPARTAVADTLSATWVQALWLLPMGLGFTILPLLGARASWNVERYLRSDR